MCGSYARCFELKHTPGRCLRWFWYWNPANSPSFPQFRRRNRHCRPHPVWYRSFYRRTFCKGDGFSWVFFCWLFWKEKLPLESQKKKVAGPVLSAYAPRPMRSHFLAVICVFEEKSSGTFSLSVPLGMPDLDISLVQELVAKNPSRCGEMGVQIVGTQKLESEVIRCGFRIFWSCFCRIWRSWWLEKSPRS